MKYIHIYQMICRTINRTLNKVRHGIKIKFYKILITPARLNGNEARTRIRMLENAILFSEMKFLVGVKGRENSNLVVTLLSTK